MAGVSAHAQITVNNTQLWQVGKQYISKDILSQGSGQPYDPTTGGNKTWDLRGYIVEAPGSPGYDGFDTLAFVSPNGTPFFSNFPTANLAAGYGTTPADAGYTYLNNSPAGMFMLGYRGNQATEDNGDSLIFRDHYTYQNGLLLPLPLTFGQNQNYTYSGNRSSYTRIVIGGVPVIDVESRTGVRVNGNIAVNAWGNAILPNTTASIPVLRAQRYEITIDTNYTFNPATSTWDLDGIDSDTSLAHEYFSNSGEGMLAQVQIDPATLTPAGATYVFEVSNVGNVKNRASVPVAKAFPSPAVTNISIDLNTVAGHRADEVRIVASNGRVLTHKFAAVSNELLEITLGNYAPGIYSYQVLNAGEVVGQGRFAVQR